MKFVIFSLPFHGRFIFDTENAEVKEHKGIRVFNNE